VLWLILQQCPVRFDGKKLLYICCRFLSALCKMELIGECLAGSCPKCHAAVVPGMRSCQFCGAPVEYIEPAAESPQTELSSAEEAPNSAGNAGSRGASRTAGREKASDKKRSALFNMAKIVAGPVAVIFVLFIASRMFFLFPMFGHSSGISLVGPSEQSSSASSSLNSGELGVEIYPGARALSDADHSDSSASTIVSQTFLTDAPMDQVTNFYKAKMIGQTSIFANGDGMVVSISPNPQETILVTISPAQSGGRTRIAISHTTNKS
jgi:hypothetical protein